MTVPNTNNRNDHVGNGSIPNYAYSFKIFASSDLLATEEDTSGVVSPLVEGVDYTVNGVGVATGGTIDLISGGSPRNLPLNHKLALRRVPPLKQLTDLRNRGGFFPEDHEIVFDKIVMSLQDMQDQLDRSIKFPETDGVGINSVLTPAAIRKNLFLSLGALGQIIAGPGPISGTTVSGFGASLVDDATASDALTTLGASGFIKTLLDDVDQATARATLAAAGLASNNVFTGSNIYAKIEALSGSKTITAADWNKLFHADASSGASLTLLENAPAGSRFWALITASDETSGFGLQVTRSGSDQLYFKNHWGITSLIFYEVGTLLEFWSDGADWFIGIAGSIFTHLKGSNGSDPGPILNATWTATGAVVGPFEVYVGDLIFIDAEAQYIKDGSAGLVDVRCGLTPASTAVLEARASGATHIYGTTGNAVASVAQFAHVTGMFECTTAGSAYVRLELYSFTGQISNVLTGAAKIQGIKMR